jgi:hypothetical protein
MPKKKAEKPFKGFDRPRRWLQILLADESVENIPLYIQTDEEIHKMACQTLASDSGIDVVLVLDGAAKLAAVRSQDILAEYRRDDVGDGSQKQIQVVADPRPC